MTPLCHGANCCRLNAGTAGRRGRTQAARRASSSASYSKVQLLPPPHKLVAEVETTRRRADCIHEQSVPCGMYRTDAGVRSLSLSLSAGRAAATAADASGGGIQLFTQSVVGRLVLLAWTVFAHQHRVCHQSYAVITRPSLDWWRHATAVRSVPSFTYGSRWSTMTARGDF